MRISETRRAPVTKALSIIICCAFIYSDFIMSGGESFMRSQTLSQVNSALASSQKAQKTTLAPRMISASDDKSTDAQAAERGTGSRASSGKLAAIFAHLLIPGGLVAVLTHLSAQGAAGASLPASAATAALPAAATQAAAHTGFSLFSTAGAVSSSGVYAASAAAGAISLSTVLMTGLITLAVTLGIALVITLIVCMRNPDYRELSSSANRGPADRFFLSHFISTFIKTALFVTPFSILTMFVGFPGPLVAAALFLLIFSFDRIDPKSGLGNWLYNVFLGSVFTGFVFGIIKLAGAEGIALSLKSLGLTNPVVTAVMLVIVLTMFSLSAANITSGLASALAGTLFKVTSKTEITQADIDNLTGMVKQLTRELQLEKPSGLYNLTHPLEFVEGYIKGLIVNKLSQAGAQIIKTDKTTKSIVAVKTTGTQDLNFYPLGKGYSGEAYTIQVTMTYSSSVSKVSVSAIPNESSKTVTVIASLPEEGYDKVEVSLEIANAVCKALGFSPGTQNINEFRDKFLDTGKDPFDRTDLKNLPTGAALQKLAPYLWLGFLSWFLLARKGKASYKLPNFKPTPLFALLLPVLGLLLFFLNDLIGPLSAPEVLIPFLAVGLVDFVVGVLHLINIKEQKLDSIEKVFIGSGIITIILAILYLLAAPGFMGAALLFISGVIAAGSLVMLIVGFLRNKLGMVVTSVRGLWGDRSNLWPGLIIAGLSLILLGVSKIAPSIQGPSFLLWFIPFAIAGIYNFVTETIMKKKIPTGLAGMASLSAYLIPLAATIADTFGIFPVFSVVSPTVLAFYTAAVLTVSTFFMENKFRRLTKMVNLAMIFTTLFGVLGIEAPDAAATALTSIPLTPQTLIIGLAAAAVLSIFPLLRYITQKKAGEANAIDYGMAAYYIFLISALVFGAFGTGAILPLAAIVTLFVVIGYLIRRFQAADESILEQAAHAAAADIKHTRAAASASAASAPASAPAAEETLAGSADEVIPGLGITAAQFEERLDRPDSGEDLAVSVLRGILTDYRFHITQSLAENTSITTEQAAELFAAKIMVYYRTDYNAALNSIREAVSGTSIASEKAKEIAAEILAYQRVSGGLDLPVFYGFIKNKFDSLNNNISEAEKVIMSHEARGTVFPSSVHYYAHQIAVASEQDDPRVKARGMETMAKVMSVLANYKHGRYSQRLRTFFEAVYYCNEEAADGTSPASFETLPLMPDQVDLTRHVFMRDSIAAFIKLQGVTREEQAERGGAVLYNLMAPGNALSLKWSDNPAAVWSQCAFTSFLFQTTGLSGLDKKLFWDVLENLFDRFHENRRAAWGTGRKGYTDLRYVDEFLKPFLAQMDTYFNAHQKVVLGAEAFYTKAISYDQRTPGVSGALAYDWGALLKKPNVRYDGNLIFPFVLDRYNNAEHLTLIITAMCETAGKHVFLEKTSPESVPDAARQDFNDLVDYMLASAQGGLESFMIGYNRYTAPGSVGLWKPAGRRRDGRENKLLAAHPYTLHEIRRDLVNRNYLERIGDRVIKILGAPHSDNYRYGMQDIHRMYMILYSYVLGGYKKDPQFIKMADDIIAMGVGMRAAIEQPPDKQYKNDTGRPDSEHHLWLAFKEILERKTREFLTLDAAAPVDEVQLDAYCRRKFGMISEETLSFLFKNAVPWGVSKGYIPSLDASLVNSYNRYTQWAWSILERTLDTFPGAFPEVETKQGLITPKQIDPYVRLGLSRDGEYSQRIVEAFYCILKSQQLWGFVTSNISGQDQKTPLDPYDAAAILTALIDKKYAGHRSKDAIKVWLAAHKDQINRDCAAGRCQKIWNELNTAFPDVFTAPDATGKISTTPFGNDIWRTIYNAHLYIRILNNFERPSGNLILNILWNIGSRFSAWGFTSFGETLTNLATADRLIAADANSGVAPLAVQRTNAQRRLWGFVRASKAPAPQRDEFQVPAIEEDAENLDHRSFARDAVIGRPQMLLNLLSMLPFITSIVFLMAGNIFPEYRLITAGASVFINALIFLVSIKIIDNWKPYRPPLLKALLIGILITASGLAPQMPLIQAAVSAVSAVFIAKYIQMKEVPAKTGARYKTGLKINYIPLIALSLGYALALAVPVLLLILNPSSLITVITLVICLPIVIFMYYTDIKRGVQGLRKALETQAKVSAAGVPVSKPSGPGPREGLRLREGELIKALAYEASTRYPYCESPAEIAGAMAVLIRDSAWDKNDYMNPMAKIGDPERDTANHAFQTAFGRNVNETIAFAIEDPAHVHSLLSSATAPWSQNLLTLLDAASIVFPAEFATDYHGRPLDGRDPEYARSRRLVMDFRERLIAYMMKKYYKDSVLIDETATAARLREDFSSFFAGSLFVFADPAFTLQRNFSIKLLASTSIIEPRVFDPGYDPRTQPYSHFYMGTNQTSSVIQTLFEAQASEPALAANLFSRMVEIGKDLGNAKPVFKTLTAMCLTTPDDPQAWEHNRSYNARGMKAAQELVRSLDPATHISWLVIEAMKEVSRLEKEIKAAEKTIKDLKGKADKKDDLAAAQNALRELTADRSKYMFLAGFLFMGQFMWNADGLLVIEDARARAAVIDSFKRLYLDIRTMLRQRKDIPRIDDCMKEAEYALHAAYHRPGNLAYARNFVTQTGLQTTRVLERTGLQEPVTALNRAYAYEKRAADAIAAMTNESRLLNADKLKSLREMMKRGKFAAWKYRKSESVNPHKETFLNLLGGHTVYSFLENARDRAGLGLHLPNVTAVKGAERTRIILLPQLAAAAFFAVLMFIGGIPFSLSAGSLMLWAPIAALGALVSVFIILSIRLSRGQYIAGLIKQGKDSYARAAVKDSITAEEILNTLKAQVAARKISNLAFRWFVAPAAEEFLSSNPDFMMVDSAVQAYEINRACGTIAAACFGIGQTKKHADTPIQNVETLFANPGRRDEYARLLIEQGSTAQRIIGLRYFNNKAAADSCAAITTFRRLLVNNRGLGRWGDLSAIGDLLSLHGVESYEWRRLEAHHRAVYDAINPAYLRAQDYNPLIARSKHPSYRDEDTFAYTAAPEIKAMYAVWMGTADVYDAVLSGLAYETSARGALEHMFSKDPADLIMPMENVVTQIRRKLTLPDSWDGRGAATASAPFDETNEVPADIALPARSAAAGTTPAPSSRGPVSPVGPTAPAAPRRPAPAAPSAVPAAPPAAPAATPAPTAPAASRTTVTVLDFSPAFSELLETPEGTAQLAALSQAAEVLYYTDTCREASDNRALVSYGTVNAECGAVIRTLVQCIPKTTINTEGRLTKKALEVIMEAIAEASIKQFIVGKGRELSTAEQLIAIVRLILYMQEKATRTPAVANVDDSNVEKWFRQIGIGNQEFAMAGGKKIKDILNSHPKRVMWALRRLIVGAQESTLAAMVSQLALNKDALPDATPEVHGYIKDYIEEMAFFMEIDIPDGLGSLVRGVSRYKAILRIVSAAIQFNMALKNERIAANLMNKAQDLALQCMDYLLGFYKEFQGDNPAIHSRLSAVAQTFAALNAPGGVTDSNVEAYITAWHELLETKAGDNNFVTLTILDPRVGLPLVDTEDIKGQIRTLKNNGLITDTGVVAEEYQPKPAPAAEPTSPVSTWAQMSVLQLKTAYDGAEASRSFVIAELKRRLDHPDALGETPAQRFLAASDMLAFFTLADEVRSTDGSITIAKIAVAMKCTLYYGKLIAELPPQDVTMLLGTFASPDLRNNFLMRLRTLLGIKDDSAHQIFAFTTGVLSQRAQRQVLQSRFITLTAEAA